MNSHSAPNATRNDFQFVIVGLFMPTSHAKPISHKFRVDFDTNVRCAPDTLGDVIFRHAVSITTRYGDGKLLFKPFTSVQPKYWRASTDFAQLQVNLFVLELTQAKYFIKFLEFSFQIYITPIVKIIINFFAIQK